MAKQLRLDVAQLTDVGRKREHNEDNMAYVIPKDPQAMTKKGALFIVADGMGGHAAGEVASEIAVDTISHAYYQEGNDDVIGSLVQAIKSANAAIHQRAAENMSRSGMGTTCVAAVLRGNRAYIANVGDSRAYLVRADNAKQVSQDHSWVAEQVRAGLLTEDQARTHAQRNVITRCLGTQSDVEIDLFSEMLEEGDSLVLCTDGLSGLISDDDLRRIVSQFVPQESVYHLVERANENGGPDNITAIVIHVQEVGAELPNGRRPVYVGGRETSEDARTSGSLITTVPLALAPAASDKRSGPLRMVSGPLNVADSTTAPQSTITAPRRGRGRLLYPTLGIIILLLVALGSGAYYVSHLSASFQQAQALVSQAKGEVQTAPARALEHLASAQSILQALEGSQLGDQASHLLRGELTSIARQAIQTYNHQAAITPLCPSMAAVTPINEGSTNTHAVRLAPVQASTGPGRLYALGLDEHLYQLKQLANASSLATPLTLPGNPQVLDIAADETRLAVLLNGGSSPGYQLGLLLPDQPQLRTTTAIKPSTKDTPILLAAQGNDLYVILAPSAGAASPAQTVQVVDVAVDTDNTFKPNPTTTPFQAPKQLISVAAFPNHLLFFLLADGSVQSLQLGGSGPSAALTPVSVAAPIAVPLALGGSDLSQTPVPTVPMAAASAGSVPLVVPHADVLAVGQIGSTAHLYIGDPDQHRLLDLTSSSGGGAVGNRSIQGLQVVAQYVSGTQLSQIQSIAVNSKEMKIYLLTENTASPSSLLSISINGQAQTPCA